MVTFLKNRFGEDRVNAQIFSLAPEDQALWPATILDGTWYAYEIWRPIRRISRALATRADANLSVEMGRFLADYCFSGAYKSLLVKDPIKQVRKFSWVHDFFYKDAHKLEPTILGPTSCLVRYRYAAGLCPAPSSCASTVGFWLRTIELTGGTNVKVAHDKCMIDGGECCEFLVQWQ